MTVRVVSQYPKNDYTVLKLKNRSLSFYTTTRESLKPLLNRDVTLVIVTKKVDFLSYLDTFYAPSFYMRLERESPRRGFIKEQHSDPAIASLFLALFYADAPEYTIRKQFSTLGVAHLVALSGLHLGLLSALIYFLLTPFYKLLQRRYFPYRNRHVDLGITVLITLFFYLYLTGFPPSLVRSFVMEGLFFLFAYYLRDIFNFKVLLFTVVISLILFPSFIKSIGFLLSVMGVFYIFLFFRQVKMTLFHSLITLPFYLFIVMFPVSHLFFGYYNPYQLLSPFVSLLFSLFYPLEIFLHLIGEGGILDSCLQDYLSLGESYVKVKTEKWQAAVVLFLSLYAYFSKRGFYLLTIFSIIVLIILIKAPL